MASSLRLGFARGRERGMAAQAVAALGEGLRRRFVAALADGAVRRRDPLCLDRGAGGAFRRRRMAGGAVYCRRRMAGTGPVVQRRLLGQRRCRR